MQGPLERQETAGSGRSGQSPFRSLERLQSTRQRVLNWRKYMNACPTTPPLELLVALPGLRNVLFVVLVLATIIRPGRVRLILRVARLVHLELEITKRGID